jgi:hypothetical protein
MIFDGSNGWYWQLKSLPERVQKYDVPVRFIIIEREIGDGFCSRMMMVDEGVVAYNIDVDTLLGILFDESLKSKCIATIDEKWRPMSIDVTIVLVQGAEGYTNIDSDVLGCFEKVIQK